MKMEINAKEAFDMTVNSKNYMENKQWKNIWKKIKKAAKSGSYSCEFYSSEFDKIAKSKIEEKFKSLGYKIKWFALMNVSFSLDWDKSEVKVVEPWE